MKSILNRFFLFALFALFSFTACQDEATELDNPNAQETVVPSSLLANLVSRTTANFGASDDILDGSNCFSVELPVTFVIENITVTVETESDLDQLYDILDNFEGDILDFVFPITIVFNDYTELVIDNEGQLQNVINQCNTDAYNLIECVDFVYPLAFSIFDSYFNLLDINIIENDEALYHFIDDLENDDNVIIASLNFPIKLEFANGEIIEINSNQQLTDALESAEENCTAFNENECNEEDIDSLLLECPWDIFDAISSYENYQLIFYTDGTLAITEGETTSAIGGFWNLSTTDDGLILRLFELTAFQDDLGGEWLIVECNDDVLKIIRGDTTIELGQNCEDDLNCNLNTITTNLKECLWELAAYSSYPEFVGLDLEFYEDATFSIFQNGEVYNIDNNWSLNLVGNTLFLVLDTNFEDLGGSWQIIQCDDDRFELVKANQSIILEQDCEIGNPFECFESFDAKIEVCDNGTDGLTEFNLNLAFSNCEADEIIYYTSVSDAESAVNPIANPTTYNTADAESTVFAKVKINNQFSIFPTQLLVIDCSNESCTVEDVDAILIECIWNVVSFNGSDSLIEYNFDFEANTQTVVIYTSEITIDAMWSTFQSSQGVIIAFSNVSGPNIQAITGEWLVVECENNRLKIQRENDILILERACN